MRVSPIYFRFGGTDIDFEADKEDKSLHHRTKIKKQPKKQQKYMTLTKHAFYFFLFFLRISV